MAVWKTANPSERVTKTENLRPPQTITFTEAQQVVNFVVFVPEWVPEDCKITEITVRPEQPPGRPDSIDSDDIGQTPHSEGNPCSLRVVISGEDRQLRLKQFLYDWAPPAASIAPLWGTRDPTPFECHDAIGWLGTDYKGQRGACIQLKRTQIELTVSNGEFNDEELKSIFKQMTQTDTEAGRLVQSVPFHQLNYWVRYQYQPPGVPHGLLKHAPKRPYDNSCILSPLGFQNDLPVTPLVPTGDQFVFDSAVTFPESEAVEYIYRHRENNSDHLWITAASAESSLAPSLTGDPAEQPAKTRQNIDLRKTNVQYATLTEEYGAWEAIWKEEDIHYAVWASASQFLNDNRFRTIVNSLENP